MVQEFLKVSHNDILTGAGYAIRKLRILMMVVLIVIVIPYPISITITITMRSRRRNAVIWSLPIWYSVKAFHRLGGWQWERGRLAREHGGDAALSGWQWERGRLAREHGAPQRLAAFREGGRAVGQKVFR